ncbi:DUF3365 domain-containing protein [uncultured Draconibacterium sp.]|uniref:c-type heme family protein n=1 Tax=uncultured Draconibacterium sp. TaxID=1573823 RepID=UPI0025E830F2|nr:DUF3365 domain-containing protein [uncultured Draconibacterium sp.]
MKTKILVLLFFAFCWSCGKNIDRETYSKYQKNGQQITEDVQAVLLQNVGAAIQKGGSEYAVEFCNLQAGELVDSLNEVYNCMISRVSAKNRNPENALQTNEDKQLWEIFSARNVADTLIQSGNNLVYYKPIRIGLPACLKCHGNIETDINTATRQKLQHLYPADLATGYQLSDFRGLWKIEFQKNH